MKTYCGLKKASDLAGRNRQHKQHSKIENG